jgi:hypothetical protein
MPFKVTIERIETKPAKKVSRVKSSDDYYAECKAKGIERNDDESETYRTNTARIVDDVTVEERTVLYEQTLQEVDIVRVIAAANKVDLQS